MNQQRPQATRNANSQAAQNSKPYDSMSRLGDLLPAVLRQYDAAHAKTAARPQRTRQ